MDSKNSLTDIMSRAFVGAPVLKTVKFKLDGVDHEMTVRVRKLSYQSAINDGRAFSKNPDAFVAGRIAACVLDEEGTPLFASIDQVMGTGSYVEQGALCDSLTCALFDLVLEVNPTGKSILPQTTNSGANSSSTVSAATPSKPRKRRSASMSSESGTRTDKNAVV